MKKKNVAAARAWARLRAHAKSMSRVHVRDLFAKDPDRFPDFSRVACGLLGDFSRQRMTQQTLDLLCELAEASGLGRAIDDLFAGKHVNSTETGPALHVALRAPTKKPRIVDRVDVAKLVHAERARLEEFTAAVHSGARTGASGRSFTAVVNIGIGGSDLRPLVATEAPRFYGQHFRRHLL